MDYKDIIQQAKQQTAGVKPGENAKPMMEQEVSKGVSCENQIMEDMIERGKVIDQAKDIVTQMQQVDKNLKQHGEETSVRIAGGVERIEAATRLAEERITNSASEAVKTIMGYAEIAKETADTLENTYNRCKQTERTIECKLSEEDRKWVRNAYIQGVKEANSGMSVVSNKFLYVLVGIICLLLMSAVLLIAKLYHFGDTSAVGGSLVTLSAVGVWKLILWWVKRFED